MKRVLFIFFLLPLSCFAQYDFENRYFTINATSLPEVQAVYDFTKPTTFDSKFTLDAAPNVVSRGESSFKLTTQNYREPVEMAVAVTQINKFVNTSRINQPQTKTYSIRGYNGYNANKSSKNINIVYKEQKGLNFLDPCPPIGICPRCAPYKVGRGY